MIGLLSFEENETLRCLISDGGRFYTGLIPFLEDKGISFEIDDRSPTPTVPVKDARLLVEPEILDTRVLRDYQVKGVTKALAEGRGVIESPTGSGKTEMAAAAVEHFRHLGLGWNTVFLTPTVFLMQQTAKKLEQFGFTNVARVGGGHHYNGEDIAVYVVNSALNDIKSGDDFIRKADILVLDEAHHAKADSWIRVCEACKAPIRLSFTATLYDSPEKYSYEDLVLLGLTGRMFYSVRSAELRRRGFLADPLVTVLPVKAGRIPVWGWSKVYRLGVVGNTLRNSMIVTLAESVYRGGHKAMVFVGQKKHGHLFGGMLAYLGCESVFVHGGSTVHIYNKSGSVQTKRWDVDDIGNYVNSRDRCILITTQVLDEGLDVPVINVLIMATGMKKYRRTVQRAGRGMRPKAGQNRVFIFDFWDTNHPYLQKQSEYRLWTYTEEEFELSSSLEYTSKVIGCPLVADSSVMRGFRG